MLSYVLDLAVSRVGLVGGDLAVVRFESCIRRSFAVRFVESCRWAFPISQAATLPLGASNLAARRL